MLRLALVTLVASLAACGDEPVSVNPPPAPQTQIPPAHKVSWLEVDSELPPALWLISRDHDALRPANDPEVQRVKKLLDDAHRLYRESQRMIANRTVQIEAMLRAKGHDDSAVMILDDLAAVAGEVGQAEGYGAMGQHYVNMRGNGISREESLAKLKNLYGKRQ